MHRWIAVIVLLVSCAAATADGIDYARIDPLVEARGIWLDSSAIPRTVQGMRQLMRCYRAAHLNVIFPEVIGRGYALYPSKLLARDPRFVGSPDILAMMIKEAHAVGIEVHPWVWVFRVGYTADRGSILRAHPEWAELSKNGQDLSPNGGLWLSPAVPAARDFLADVFAELVRDYDVDGLHLDYIRYEDQSSAPYGFNSTSRALFLAQYGIDPASVERLSFHQLEWEKFRERQVSTFLQRVALQTRAIKPNVRISAAVAADRTWARTGLMQNWPNWVDNKWVDFVVPMAYTTDDAQFRRNLSNDAQAVGSKTLMVAGIGFFEQKDPMQMTRQIGITRELGAEGQALFASSYFKEPQAAALKQGPYAHDSALPFRQPLEKSRLLCERAAQLKSEGRLDEAAYFTLRSASLADYAKYQASAVPYVPPSPPPLIIPDSVLPLPRLEIPRIERPVRVDGILDSSEWGNAAKVTLGHTNLGEPAAVETIAYLAYDNDNLYIGFECPEPDMPKIKVAADKRDGPTFYDDSVEVFLDPSATGKSYYHLSTNTLGTQFDEKVQNAAWNADWKTATKVGGDVWTTEIAAPFAALGSVPPIAGTRWNLNLTRNRTTSGTVEHFVWSVPYGGFHTPDRFGGAIFR